MRLLSLDGLGLSFCTVVLRKVDAGETERAAYELRSDWGPFHGALTFLRLDREIPRMARVQNLPRFHARLRSTEPFGHDLIAKLRPP